MIESTFAFFGIIIFLLMAYGSFAKLRLYSILGSMLLLIFGIFVFSDGIQLKTGEQVLTTGTISEPCNCTLETAHTYNLNATTTYIYADPPKISVFDWNFMVGLILILAGLSGMYIFALED
jgi:hypothetical protein